MSDACEVCTLPSERQPRALRLLTIATLLTLPFGLYMALVHAGTDTTQGDVQRIFYLHMPAFFGAALAFGGAMLAGIGYLRTRETCYDSFAVAGVEVGLTLALVNLVSGAIWARPIWNTWWTWDPRLTSAAIMCLTYAAWLMLRNGIDNAQQRRRLASIYGIPRLRHRNFDANHHPHPPGHHPSGGDRPLPSQCPGQLRAGGQPRRDGGIAGQLPHLVAVAAANPAVAPLPVAAAR